MDMPLFKAQLQVELKQITFALEENSQGTFLRITEEVHGHRNSIVIPTTGLEPFRDSLNEAIKFNQTPVGSGPVLALGQPDAVSGQ
jgi:hypothetical protein